GLLGRPPGSERAAPHVQGDQVLEARGGRVAEAGLPRLDGALAHAWERGELPLAEASAPAEGQDEAAKVGHRGIARLPGCHRRSLRCHRAPGPCRWPIIAAASAAGQSTDWGNETVPQLKDEVTPSPDLKSTPGQRAGESP